MSYMSHNDSGSQFQIQKMRLKYERMKVNKLTAYLILYLIRGKIATPLTVVEKQLKVALFP